jgi:hypothetical protein
MVFTNKKMRLDFRALASAYCGWPTLPFFQRRGMTRHIFYIVKVATVDNKIENSYFKYSLICLDDEHVLTVSYGLLGLKIILIYDKSNVRCQGSCQKK